MAYSYVNQAFTRYVYDTYNSYYTGGNILCGQVKDFILANIPDSSVDSDNNPPLNTAGGTHSTVSRLIRIKIRGVGKIEISGYPHGNTVPYGSCLIKFLGNTTVLGSSCYSSLT